MLNLNGLWLMAGDYFDTMGENYTRLEVDPEKFQAFIERISSNSGSQLVIRDGVAHIPVMGPLTTEPEVFFSIFGGGGGTVYGDISKAVREADGDPDVKQIVLQIDSPGGDMAGFFETARAIQDAKTPVEAQVTNMCASAAYGLACQADHISVQNPMTLIGSVGVVTNRFVSDSRVTLRSTEAPRKNPDADTSEGAQAIVKELDAIHAEFVQVIASGRSEAGADPVTVATVNSNYGRGGLLVAGDALAAGMVDAIAGATTTGASLDPGSPTESDPEETQVMTRAEFQAQYPEIYQAIFDAGIAQERDRVTAHVTAAEACGNTKIGLAFIADGSDFSSQNVQAKYLTAGMNNNDVQARSDDDNDANTGKADANDGKPDEGDADAKTNAMFDGLALDLGVTI